MTGIGEGSRTVLRHPSAPSAPAIAGRDLSAVRPKVLVTGGGALAAAFAARWLADESEVVVLDDGRTPGLAELAANPAVDVERGDAADGALLRRCVAGCDLVVHFAADPGAPPAAPDERLDAAVLGTRAVLRACLDAGRPVLLGSSADVYGRTAGILHEASPRLLGASVDPGWHEAVAALAAEDYAVALGARGLRYAIARYFDVYGPRIDRPGVGLVGRFVGDLRDGTPLRLVAGGTAERALCFVDDAVEATALLGAALARGEAVAGRAFNVGGGEPVSIADLAARLARRAGHTAGVVVESGDAGAGAGEVAYRVADVAALRTAVGFAPRVSLDEGLRRSLAHWGLLDAAAAPEPPPVVARVPWVRPILEADEGLLADVQLALSTGRVTNDGPYLRELERQLARYLGVDDCVVVSSGSAALLLSIWALGLRGGTAVLPSFTFIATLNALVHAGMRPVFCDIDPDTWTLSPTHLSRILADDPSVRLVVPVNVFGVPPDLRAVRETTAARGAALLYDNAHGLGTVQGGVRCPAEPAVQTFSLHATKTLPAVEGGAVVASDPRLLAEVRRLRNHGVGPDPLALSPGFNAKMSELHAAVGLRSLRGLDAALARRREYAEQLRAVLAADGGARFAAQVVPEAVRTNFQNLGVLCRRDGRPDAAATQADLARDGIETRRYFWPALHQLPGGGGALPVTEAVAESVLCLPLHSTMEPAVLARIAAAVRRAAAERS